jgi:hypothetical protein
MIGRADLFCFSLGDVSKVVPVDDVQAIGSFFDGFALRRTDKVSQWSFS